MRTSRKAHTKEIEMIGFRSSRFEDREIEVSIALVRSYLSWDGGRSLSSLGKVGAWGGS